MAESRRPGLCDLPNELRLRILDFLPTRSLAQLNQVSKTWHHLIDDPDQDKRVYLNRTQHPPGTRDFSFLLHETSCFTEYYTKNANISSWRDLCRYQTLLGRSWSRDAPTMRTSLIAPRRMNFIGVAGVDVGGDPPRVPVWRFRPDFQRRFILATTQHGGLIVTDMDSGKLLWHLRRDQVRSYAHLEYSNGWMAFDRYNNAIEIWQHDNHPERRGYFKKVTELHHDVETRGFQMLWPTLCVTSPEERGFVYDLSASGGPKRTKEMVIGCGTGHIDQDERDAVVYCLGTEGYDFHSKSTGQKLGSLDPKNMSIKHTYHVSHRHGNSLRQSVMTVREPLSRPLPPQKPHTSQQLLVQPLREGQNTARQASLLSLENDEWGAGLLRGDMMTAISKGGRCMICLDWPGALRSSKRASDVTFLIEMEIDDATYDFGGWLGVQRGSPGPTRIICEVDDKVYIMRLTNDFDSLIDGSKTLMDAMDVLSVPSSCAPGGIEIPISFMGVYDDCIMYTCLLGIAPRAECGQDPYIAKGINVITFAPTPEEMNELSGDTEEVENVWEEVNMRDFLSQQAEGP
ncbi:MAG: hypothetical protein Q9159_002444 [Coniocarpon cinnabarinum]